LFEEGFGDISSDPTLYSYELSIFLVLRHFRKKGSFIKNIIEEWVDKPLRGGGEKGYLI